MKRIVNISVRITILLDNKINEYTDKLKLTRSKLVYEALMFYFKSKGFKDIEKTLKKEKCLAEIKETNHSLYTVKNAFMTIISISKVSLLLTGEIDYKKVELIISKYVKLYNTFKPSVKKIMKKEIDSLKMLKNKKYLMQYMSDWDIVREFILEKSRSKRVTLK